MNLIICMAGLNTRFHDVGVDCPKYLMPWKNESIITEILFQLTHSFSFSRILLLANKRDIYFRSKLELATKDFNVEIHYINDTKGQAETAEIGAKLLLDVVDEPLLIHNADTILFNRNIKAIEFQISKLKKSYIDVFSAINPAYCYVESTADNITSIEEKKKVTGKASSGLYGFPSSKFYINNYEHVATNNTASEIYISDVLIHILKNNSISSNSIVNSDVTTVIGSPKEYWESITNNSIS